MQIPHSYSKVFANNPQIICSLDWLSICYIVDREYNESLITLNNVNGYIIESCTGTNVFSSRFIIYDVQGRKKLTILADPKSNLIAKNISLIEFANHTLYTGEWLNLFNILHQFHNGYFHGFSRIDVCADFQYFINHNGELEVAENLTQKLEECDYYVKSKQKGSAFYSYSTINNIIFKKPNQLSFGAKNSEIKWKIYNKTQEIKEESHKYFLLDMYKKYHFNENLDTWRIECSIIHANSFKISNNNSDNILNFEYISNPANLSDIFLTLFDNKFVIKQNQGNSNKNRNFTLNIFGNEFHSASFSKKNAERQVLNNNAKQFVRNSIKTINDIVFSTKFSLVDGIFAQIKETIRIFGLEDWFFDEFKMDVLHYYSVIICQSRERFNVNSENLFTNNIKIEQNELQFEN